MRRLLGLLGWHDPLKVATSVLIGFLAALYAWLFLLPVLGHAAPRADDFQDYLFAARQLTIGGDPYANFIRNHVSWDWSLSSGYLYPPAFAVVLIPLTWIPNDLAVRIWLVLIQAAVFASLVIVYRMVGRPSRGELLCLSAVLLTFFPLASSVATGAMNCLLLLLLTAAWACWLRGKDVGTGLLVGVASFFKLFPLAVVPYLAWRRHWRLLAALGLTTLAGLALGFVVTRPQHNIYYFRDMLPHLGAGTGYRENQSLAGFTARICQPSTADHGGDAGWCGRLLDWPLVVALLASILLVTNRPTRSGLEFAMAVAALPLISSVTWSFHLVLLILPMALLIRRAFDRELSRLAIRVLMLAWLCFSIGPALHFLLIIHPLPHSLGFMGVALTRIIGETYVIGTVIIFGSLWFALRNARAARGIVTTEAAAA